VLSAFAILAILLLAPWNSLVTSDAFVNTLDLTVFSRLQSLRAADVVTLFALAMLCGFVFLRGRTVLVLPLLAAAAAVFASVAAAQELNAAVNSSQAAVVGPTVALVKRDRRPAPTLRPARPDPRGGAGGDRRGHGAERDVV